MNKKTFVVILSALILWNGYSQAQQEMRSDLKVVGEVKSQLMLTLDGLLKFPQYSATAKDKDGKDHQFKGVLLYKILDSAGVTLGSQLRGKNLAKYVLVQAEDGYEVIFSLAELDPELNDKIFLVAYQMDGNPLPKGEGPLRIIVPMEKKHARWIRQMKTIVIAKKEN